MKGELTPNAAQWVETEMPPVPFRRRRMPCATRFAEFRGSELRAKLDSAVAEGGSHTIGDASLRTGAV